RSSYAQRSSNLPSLGSERRKLTQSSVVVAVGVGRKPAPSTQNRFGDVGAPRAPAQLLFDLAGVGEQRRRIAGTPRARVDAKRAIDDLAHGVDNLFDAVALADAEVVDALVAWSERLHHAHVRFDQIFDVDVVADAGTVGRCVVFAEDGDL